jgi:hypothetical protein
MSKESESSPDTLLQMFVDPEEWDEATWTATVFLYDPKGLGNQPAGIGIGFADFERGKEIFKGWVNRVGHVDRFEELRVSIIEGPIPGEPDGYTVFLSSNPANTIRRKQETDTAFDPKTLIVVSRRHRMEPAPDSPHLRMFKQTYDHQRKYLLFPAHVSSNALKDMELKLGILKKEIHFIHSSNIQTNDPEIAAIC